jgi:hypothetical protein
MHVVDPQRCGNEFKDYRYITDDEIAGFKAFHTLPDRVEPEINVKTSYRLGWFIPFAVFTRVTGAAKPVSGEIWRGGVFKCGDETSKPHYLSWMVLDELNFHNPRNFGEFIFE